VPTVITALVGHIGSGKTTWLGCKAAETHQTRPNYPIVSNLPIKFMEGKCVGHTNEKGNFEHITDCDCETAYYQEDILKWLALKLIKRDLTPMELYVDEAAQAGLESRGSGLKSTDSRLITLARKANVNLFLATQLMSMMDKRAQWNWDFSIDCESYYITPEAMARFIPDYFSYDVYDSDFNFQKNWKILGADAERYIFPMFDTMQVPLRSLLEVEFKYYYWQKPGKGRVRDFDEEAYEKDSVEFDNFMLKIDPDYIKKREAKIKSDKAQ
jgi:hypothetical protein